MFAIGILLVGFLVPGSIRLPGPTTTSTSSTSTSTTVAGATFDFGLEDYLIRWNTTAGQFAELRKEAYDTLTASGATFGVSLPAEGVDWLISVDIDPITQQARSVALIAPLSADDQMVSANELGALALIASVENHNDLAAGLPILDGLWGQIDPANGGRSVTWTTSNATYRFSISRETQYYLEASP